MTRRGTLAAGFTLAVVLLMLAGAWVDVAVTDWVAASGPGDTTSTPPIAAIVIRMADGSEYVYALQGQATPVPSSTPPPTNTPRPSHTPASTATLTPEPSPAASIVPSPTPETRCYGTVIEGPLRVRDAPWGGVLGAVNAGDTLALEAVTYDDDGAPWYRVFWLPGTPGWVYGSLIAIPDGVDCSGLPQVRTRAPSVGWTVTIGASFDVLMRARDTLAQDGIPLSATVVGDLDLATKLHDAGVIVNVRMTAPFFDDCPDMTQSPQDAAQKRVNQARVLLQYARFDVVQITNECIWPSAAYLDAFQLETVRLCDDLDWSCMPVVWATGHPPLEWLPELERSHCAMRDGGHYYGLNLYPFAPDTALMTRTAWTQYTTWRWELIAARMRCRPAMWVTELAAGEVEPDLGDVAAFLRATWGEFAAVNVWYYPGGNVLAAWPRSAWTAAQVVRLAGMVADSSPPRARSPD